LQPNSSGMSHMDSHTVTANPDLAQFSARLGPGR
jgi:hypothetical protein